jgi:hypothetical protein
MIVEFKNKIVLFYLAIIVKKTYTIYVYCIYICIIYNVIRIYIYIYIYYILLCIYIYLQLLPYTFMGRLILLNFVH